MHSSIVTLAIGLMANLAAAQGYEHGMVASFA